jgi:hypothetical protein
MMRWGRRYGWQDAVAPHETVGEAVHRKTNNSTYLYHRSASSVSRLDPLLLLDVRYWLP